MEICFDADFMRTIRNILRFIGDPYLLMWWKVIEAYHWPRWTNARRKGWAKCPDVYINFSFRKYKAPFLHFPAFRYELFQQYPKEKNVIYVDVVYE